MGSAFDLSNNDDAVNSQQSKSNQNRNKISVDKSEIKKIIKMELAQLNHLYERDALEHTISNDIKNSMKSKKSSSQEDITKCSKCSKIFKNRQHFLDSTKYISGDSLVFDNYGFREVRECGCGYQVSMWEPGSDRRDCSYLGCLKRILFSNCVNKLTDYYQLDPENDDQDLAFIKEQLRFFFNKNQKFL